ncbi:MAG: RNA methyltransferase [Rhodobacteraceae bacterium]|nr:RNA methyltransferase [Paracoccaceae bacterium]
MSAKPPIRRKPAAIVAKERARKAAARETVWLFGLHAVAAALRNPARARLRLVVTKNAADRLADAIAESGMAPEIADPRRFPAPLDPGSVHQGAALEARPLDWGRPEDRALGARDVWVALDRVTDPHNVGAILRSAAVFGAAAVLAPARHAAPETGALAKAASGALEAVPYLRVPNLGNALAGLSARGLYLVGLAGEADRTLGAALAEAPPGPRGIVLGARGPGCAAHAGSVPRSGADSRRQGFVSLNVSNAASVALYAAEAGLGDGARPEQPRRSRIDDRISTPAQP